MRNLVVVVACVLVAGCKAHDKPAPPPPAGSNEMIATGSAACPTGEREGSLEWIRDDYDGALACAKAKHVPVVIDLWAPWCHTCLSMQTTVMNDLSFAGDASKFVFASLDTDKDVNAAALTKLSISAWPTFYVIGADETVLARFVGAASLAQFHAFLDAAAGGGSPADGHLLAAERALAAKDLATADTELTAALAAAPPAWPRTPDVLGSLIMTKEKRGDLSGCLDLAAHRMNDTGNAAVASDFLVSATDCADRAEADKKPAATIDAKLIAKLRGDAVTRWKALLADGAAPLSVDDRSDAMASLRDTLDKLGNKADAKAIAEAQAKLLDDAATKAPTPLAAMTYNWPRAEVYVYLGRPLDLVPALEKSAADLPKEYDPPARLGWLLFKAGKLADAAAWTDKALALAYGPRKARLLGLRADIAKAAGDRAGEAEFRAKAVAQYEGLPKGEEMPEALAAAKAALAATGATGSAG